MKKKLIIGSGMLGMFLLGSIVSADGEDFGDMVNNAKREVREAGYNKKEEIITNMPNDINAKLKDTVDGEVAENSDEVVQGIDAEYQALLDAIEETPQVQDMKQDLDVEADTVVDTNKVLIEEAFAEYFEGQ
jgi:hypothetical protein